MRKIRILFIHGPLGGGGAERVLIDILNNFDYTKYEIDLALITAQGVLLSEVPKCVHIIPLWDGYTLSYKLAYRMSCWFHWNGWLKYALKKKITKKYDCEISFLEGMPLKLHAILDTSALKISWVHTDLDRFRYEAPQFFPGEEIVAYNKMDYIVCVSNDALMAFNKRFPECTSQRIVIYNPIDINKITRLACDKLDNISYGTTIVSVGRLTPPKRMDRIIRLAHRFKAEHIDAHFQIIGAGECHDELVTLCRELQVTDNVELLGFQSNPFPYIKNSDILVSCSDFEGFCLVICEAMCLGVPVVSTRTSGPCEILEESKYGVLVDCDDEAIFQAVKLLVQDPELRKYYSKQGRQRVAKFSVHQTMNQIYNLIGCK